MTESYCLQDLQAEIDALRQQYGKSLRLRRERAEGTAPFREVVVTHKLELSASLASFDLDAFTVQLRVLPAVLVVNLDASQRAAGVECEVLADLPQPLCKHVADLLHQQWAKQLGDGTDAHQLGLGSVFQHAEGRLVDLLTSDSSFLEPYQSVDVDGATLRRYAFVDPSAAPAQAEKPLINKPTAAQAIATLHSAGLNGQAEAQPAAGFVAGSPANAELAFLKRRFRQALGLSPVSSPQLAEKYPHSASESDAPSIHFELPLQPTDAVWDSTFHLSVQGQLHASYPRPGSWSLHIEPSSSVSAKQAEVMVKLAEPAALGKGGANPLRSILRHLENNAGLLAQEAQDIIMEADRRRSQAAADPGSSAASHAASHAAASQEQHHASMKQDLADMGLDAGYAMDTHASDSAAGYTSYASTGFDHTGESDSDSEGSGSGSSTTDGGQHDGEASGSGTDGEQAERQELRGSAAQQAGGSVRGALDLTLLDLKLDSLDTLEPYNLVFQVACNRCGKCQDLSRDLSGNQAHRTHASMELSCAECHQPWRIEIFARLVHATSNVLVRMRPSGCNPIDLLPSLMAGQCSACSSMAAFRQAQIGKANERGCSKCHTPLTFSFHAVSFMRAQQPSASGSSSARDKAREGRRRGNREVPIQQGQPLPGTGTCKHYHHSHRWLRFPCCGHRFPCDLCHEEQTDGHEMKWATRMLCGYCSTEQALGERCRVCEKKLARSTATQAGRPTRFWEGGKGCRDPKRMDRHDPHRYRNSRSKTRSKKSSRVGQEGAGKHKPSQ